MTGPRTVPSLSDIGPLLVALPLSEKALFGTATIFLTGKGEAPVLLLLYLALGFALRVLGDQHSTFMDWALHVLRNRALEISQYLLLMIRL